MKILKMNDSRIFLQTWQIIKVEKHIRFLNPYPRDMDPY